MQGDRDAFGALADQHMRRMVGTAGLMLRSRDAADDAAQEALVRAWRDLPSLRDPDRFQPWLYRVLVRTCHDHLRRSASRSAIHRVDQALDLATADPADSVAERDAVDAGLSRLTPDQRTILVLRYYLDLSLEEISGVIGVPVGTVKSRTHRALRAMHAAMAAEERRPVQEPTA